VDPLSQPGLTDITANVDFASLKRAMIANGWWRKALKNMSC
jgi:SAM-dependent MidA family methyltransferase